MKKKKTKVYIPTYKIIILCISIIAICMTLLLITTIASGENRNNKSESQNTQTISERFYSEKESENKKTISTDEIKKKTTTEIKPLETTEKKSETENKKEQNTNQNVKKQSESEIININTETIHTKVADNSNNQQTKKQNEEIEKNTVSTTSPKTNTINTNTTTIQKPTVTTTEKPIEQTKPQKTDFGFPKAVNNAQLVFVFDDGGQNLNQLEKFMELPFPITVAVLPQITHTTEAAARIRKSGNEVILHQPMQALNSNVNPGPGAITPDMTEDEIRSILFQNINQLGSIAGINNHEGSAITADSEKMSIILQTASENGIYFLDSRTNSETKVPYVAEELGFSYYERDIFLDNTKNRSDILAEINRGLSIANKNGVAIMIGHIWSANVLPDLLKEIYPELKQKGYVFTTVSNSKGKK